MHLLSKAILAGAAAIAVASAAVPAVAQGPQPRVVNLLLPDGQIVQVRYAGDARPAIAAPVAPLFVAMPQPDPVFAMMDRMSAMMQRQASAMLREAAQISTLPAMQMMPAGMQPGTRFYSVTTSFSSNGACTQSTEISYNGAGAKPRMVSSTSGDCGQQPANPTFQLSPGQAAPQNSTNRLITASAADSYKQMIRPAMLVSR